MHRAHRSVMREILNQNRQIVLDSRDNRIETRCADLKLILIVHVTIPIEYHDGVFQSCAVNSVYSPSDILVCLVNLALFAQLSAHN